MLWFGKGGERSWLRMATVKARLDGLRTSPRVGQTRRRNCKIGDVHCQTYRVQIGHLILRHVCKGRRPLTPALTAQNYQLPQTYACDVCQGLMGSALGLCARNVEKYNFVSNNTSRDCHSFSNVVSLLWLQA